RGLREGDPPEPLAGLVLGVGTPQGLVLRRDPAGHLLGDQLLDGAGERVLVGVGEGQVERACPRSAHGGPARLAHACRAFSIWAETVSTSSVQDFLNLSTPSCSSTSSTSSKSMPTAATPAKTSWA